MVRLRLKRYGRRHLPFYRLNVMDIRTPRDGRSIEEIGTYNPLEPDAAKQITVWTVVGFALVLTGCLGVARSRRAHGAAGAAVSGPAAASGGTAADDLALDQVALPGVPTTAAVTMEA